MDIESQTVSKLEDPLYVIATKIGGGFTIIAYNEKIITPFDDFTTVEIFTELLIPFCKACLRSKGQLRLSSVKFKESSFNERNDMCRNQLNNLTDGNYEAYQLSRSKNGTYYRSYCEAKFFIDNYDELLGLVIDEWLKVERINLVLSECIGFEISKWGDLKFTMSQPTQRELKIVHQVIDMALFQ